MNTTSAFQVDPGNVVDKAASSATTAVDKTKDVTASALDSVAAKVESVRSVLSPALDNASAPLDAVVKYTRDKPINALLAAAAAGALALAVLRPARRARVR